MKISVKKADTVAQVAIAGEMTIYSAAELKEALLAAVRCGDAVEIDLAEVSELDTAGLQQLLLARREAIREGKSFSLREASRAVGALLDMYRMRGDTLEPADFGNEAAPISNGRSAT